MRLINHSRSLRAVSLCLGVAVTSVELRSARLESFRAPTRTIQFDTEEGTFINVDVSPDGRTLAFDLLGDIYTLPISGGTAKPFLTGRSWDRSPRYSPDGRSIAVVSDRGGMDRVWVWNIATHKGFEIKTVDPEPEPYSWNSSTSGTPAWLPNGREIAYGSHSDTSRIRVSPVAIGQPKWLEAADPPEKASGGLKPTATYSVSFVPDGQSAFFSETHFAPSGRSAAQTSIYRLDLKTHQRVLLTEQISGRQELKPQVSGSSKLLAYARRNKPGDTELRVRDLQSGLDRRLAAIDDYDPWRWADRGDEMPAYAFTPDDRFVVIAIGGKLHKISVADGADTPIPFKVHVTREVAKPIRASYRIPDGPLQVTSIRWPSITPDGKRLVFSALGHLYMQELPSGDPQRLTNRDDFEYMPSLSPDGEAVAYVSFSRMAEGIGPGKLMTLKLADRDPRPVNSDESSYFLPNWSPDGRRLAVIRQTTLSQPSLAEFGWVELPTSSFHKVAAAANIGGYDNAESYSELVSFSADGSRLVFSHTTTWPHMVLESASLDGSHKQEIATADREVRGILPSPDGSRAILMGNHEEAYVTRLPSKGAGLIGLKVQDTTVRPVGEGCAYFPVWRGSSTFTYSCANRVFQYDAAKNQLSPPIEVDLRVPRKQGLGTIAFRNVRIITVAARTGTGPVIEHGTIVVGGRRITAVGESSEVRIPPQATIIDLTGHTIIPGLIDAHYHGLTAPYSAALTPLQHGRVGGPSALAYGVTTGWDALGGENDGPESLAEMRDAGVTLGPRWFFAIQSLNYDSLSPPYIPSFQAAKDIVEKREANGARQVLKEYQEPNRTTTQWLAEAARQRGVGIAAHIEGLPNLLKRATDGYDVEHATISVPLHSDVYEFLKLAGTIWTPNIITQIGTATPTHVVEAQLLPALARKRGSGDSRKFDHYADAFLQTLNAPGDTSTWQYDQTTNAGVGRAVAGALAAGVKVAISGHDYPGILTHFEMWALQRGGASNADVIRAATMTGAQKLGIQQDVGSIEPGKIADLLVLTANPLDKIEDTLSLKYTVADGVIYDSDTLEEVHP